MTARAGLGEAGGLAGAVGLVSFHAEEGGGCRGAAGACAFWSGLAGACVILVAIAIWI